MSDYVGIASYAAASAAFLFLTLLLVVSWRGRLPGLLLAGASLASALWTGVVAYQYASDWVGWRLAATLEVVRNLAWFIFLASLLASGANVARAHVLRLRWMGGVAAVGCALLIAVVLIAPETWFRPNYALWLSIAQVATAIYALVLMEYIYRNSHAEQRWGIKFLILGLAAVFVLDFYLYSDAMLFKQVNADVWRARGIANALVVPLVAISAARNPTWSLDVSVSRQVVFHSATLIGAGVYLLLMAAAGYYLRLFGGTWGRVLQATFFFSGMVALVALLTSGSLRAKLRIFLAKNFFTYKYDYREEWLRFTQTLSGGEPGVQLRERAIQAVAALVESPGGALWIVNPEHTYFHYVAHWNSPVQDGSEPADSPFIRLLAQKQWVINLEDMEQRQPKESAIPRWVREVPRAWLVVPLILHEALLGFIVLTRSRGELVFNWEVSDLLKTAGRQAAGHVAHTEAAQALTVSKQFESFTRTTTFVVHDLKNLVAQLSLVLDNAQKHKRNPEFVDDMLETVDNSVRKMQRLLTQLRSGSPAEANVLPIDLGELLRRIVASKAQAQPQPTLALSEVRLTVKADSERLERVLGHLVQNAIEATPSSGKVHVALSVADDLAIIEVEDSGKGMSQAFIREQLFQPFETTKTSGMGIGAYEAREYIQELGGKIEVLSDIGVGTHITIRLPLMASLTAKSQIDNVVEQR